MSTFETTCATCKKQASLQCNQCKAIQYCNEECQRKNWLMHKFFCQAYTEMGVEIAKKHRAKIERLEALFAFAPARMMLQQYAMAAVVGGGVNPDDPSKIICFSLPEEEIKTDRTFDRVMQSIIHGARKIMQMVDNKTKNNPVTIEMFMEITEHIASAFENAHVSIFLSDRHVFETLLAIPEQAVERRDNDLCLTCLCVQEGEIRRAHEAFRSGVTFKQVQPPLVTAADVITAPIDVAIALKAQNNEHLSFVLREEN